MDTARSGTPPEYLVNANERQYLAKLCWLLQDAGTHALRTTFDSFHPALNLRQHLGQHHVKAVLQRLFDQKVLSEKQWRNIYPTKKQEIACLTSDTFDARILAVLLQFICHLSPPYPHGWSALPLPQDLSLSADIVRLQMYLQQAGSLGGVRHEEYPVLWKQIVEVLLRMGGPEVRVKIARIDQETLNPDQQAHYISLVKNSWGAPDEGGLGRLRKMGAGRFLAKGVGRGGSNKRRPGEKNSVEDEGISIEERAVINKTHRQLCDAIIAEDIVDRLVQGHAINFSDRQEILTPGKNQDRMQILLSKIIHNKVASAFKVLMEALKFKYPRVYDAVNKAKKIVQREGVSEVLDVVSICQEGLATNYRSLFSRVTPLPWSDNKTSIRDVYVPLEISTEDGKKLGLSSILPAVLTSGRGKRVLVEGESGSGKTYLTAMLTYQWASQPTYFSGHYQLLIYLDARMIRGPLAKAVHSLVLPENFKISAEEFWGLLETHARNTVVVIDGFDEDHSNEELKKVILGDELRHASVLLTSRPEARAGRWMNPDERLYVLGLSNVNVGRCLKSFAVIGQLTSEEYDEFHDIISNPNFELQSQLGSPYVCLAVFGVYQCMGSGGLSSLTTLTSLFERFLVAMATNFCRKLDMEVSGTHFSPELVAAIGTLQTLAYKTLVSKGKLLSESDLEVTVQHLRAAMEPREPEESVNGNPSSVLAGNSSKEEGSGGGGGGGTSSRGEGSVSSRKAEGGSAPGEKGKAVVVSDGQLLGRVGLVYRTGHTVARWAFTCSLTREFLAARHLADMGEQTLNNTLKEQKVLRHPRFAQTTSFLCALLRNDPESDILTSLFGDLSIQALKHGRKINFKDDVSSIGATSDDGEENGVGSYITNFSHCLQTLSECSASTPDPTADLVKSLPRSVIVQRDGLIPTKCIHGLALAVRSPSYALNHIELDLLPRHVYQSQVLVFLAQALSENDHLQNLIIRWQSLPLLVTFLKACLAKAPKLHKVILEDASRRTVTKNVSAATWAGMQEVCVLLRNTRAFTLAYCGAVHVVAQWVIYLPNTIRALHFTGSAFNTISAGDLGSKLETSEDCVTLDLSDTFLESSDLSALFHDLKLNNSLQHLSLAGSHIDRASASCLAEYIRLNNSMRRLDLSRCHVTDEACQLLASALLENHSLTTLDFTDADVCDAGRDRLTATKVDEITFLGFEPEYYA